MNAATATTIRPKAADKGFEAYFEHIVTHERTQDYYPLADHDAIGFVLGMGRIELDGAPFSTGQEMLDFVLRNRHQGVPQILFPHKSVVVLFTLDCQHPVVIVSTTARKMKQGMQEILGVIAPETAETLEYLILERGELQWAELAAKEDPADAIIIFRPDLIPFRDCYEDLRKLGYKGVVMQPGQIEIPYEHWQGGVHMHVTPVKDETVGGVHAFEDECFWGDEYYYVSKTYLSAK